MKQFELLIEKEDAGRRIDALIAEKYPEYSRSYVQKLIDDGNVTIQDKNLRSNYKARGGETVVLSIPEPEKLETKAEEIKLDILYEDNDVIVINKPQGMVVHPAAGNYSGTLVNALLAHCGEDLSGINGVMRPGIVHRIDKDTSGVLVVAKTDVAHEQLSKQVAAHSMTRRYVALVRGNIHEEKGVIRAPIIRHRSDRKKMTVDAANGREAVTHFKVLERFVDYTLIEAQLETGRTHQIRVHMSFIKHPVVGDPVYGSRKQQFNLKGQALHARVLGFVHPTKGEYMEFEAPIPEYFEKLLEVVRQEKK